MGLGYGAYLGPYAWPVWAFSTLAFVFFSWVGIKRWRRERAANKAAGVHSHLGSRCEACPAPAE